MKAYIHSYICACVHRYMQGREGEAGLAPERESNRERERERESEAVFRMYGLEINPRSTKRNPCTA